MITCAVVSFKMERREVIMACLLFALTTLSTILSFQPFYYHSESNSTCEVDTDKLKMMLRLVLQKYSKRSFIDME